VRAVRTARKPRDSGRKAVKRVGYLTDAIRLRDKLAALWQKLQLARTESRRHDDPDRRPSPAHRLRKFYPIHRSWHVSVGEHNSDIVRLSRILIASSAFDAQSGSNPASRIMSTASIKMSGSSSPRAPPVHGTFPTQRLSSAAPQGANIFWQLAASFNVSTSISIHPRSFIQ
jgi:hypothetical protein